MIDLENDEIVQVSLLILGLIVTFVLYFSLYQSSASLSEAQAEVRYSRIKCGNRSLILGFYNPSNLTYNSLKLKLINQGGEDVANIVGKLPPNQTKTLKIPIAYLNNFESCAKIKGEDLEFSWCSEAGCKTIGLEKPDREFEW